MTTATAPRRTYKFDRAYQVKLIAMMCRIKGFLNKYRPLIKASYFEDPVMQDAVRAILDYHEQYKTEPTVTALHQRLMDMVANDKKRQKMAQDYEGFSDRLRTATFDEEHDITDRVKEFAQKCAVEQAFYECVEDFQNGMIGGFAERLMQAEKSTSVLEDPGIDFFHDTTWIDWSRSADTTPTGLDKMDFLLGGGLANKELGIAFGPPNRFKTGTLINFCGNAVKRRAQGVYVSLELGQNNIAHRFAKYFMGALGEIPREKLSSHMRERMEELKERYRSSLVIRRWPPNEMTIEMLRAFLHQLVDQGKFCSPGRKSILMVDYGQLIATTNGRRRDRGDQEIRQNYQGLIRIADEFNIPVWSAVQATRPGTAKLSSSRGGAKAAGGKDAPSGKYLRMEDISECFAVAADADIILSLNQTPDEQERKEMRIYQAKVREAETGRMVVCQVDYNTMRLIEKVSAAGAARRRKVEVEVDAAIARDN